MFATPRRYAAFSLLRRRPQESFGLVRASAKILRPRSHGLNFWPPESVGEDFFIDGLVAPPSQLTSAHLSSPHFASDQIASPHLNSDRLSSAHLSSDRLTSSHLSSPQLSSPQISSLQLSSPYLSSLRLSSAQLTSPQLSSLQLSSAQLTSISLTSAHSSPSLTQDSGWNLR